jgi:uncharacterized phage-like protein YoqJ
MIEKTCCFTGHRTIAPQAYEKVRRRLRQAMENLIERGVVYFGSGGALGFDLLAAETVLDMKAQYPQIRLIMVYPCRNQTAYWPSSEIDRYNAIQKACDKYVYVSQAYTPTCMHQRNRYLVEHSGYCICYLTKPGGGTAFTVQYAREKGLKIVNLADV